MIKAENITKTYGKKSSKFQVLDQVSFSLESGRSVAIVGKSGSGKSTLMHILSGLDHASEGIIEVNGHVVSQMKPKERDLFRNKKIGFIFQSFFLQENSSVFENVMLPLEIAGEPYVTRNAKVMSVLEQVDLVGKAKNKAKDLSGGQKQRVCIARALVSDPEIIFADEPTGNLDTENGEKIFQLLLQACTEHGKTLFIVTHDPDIAARCDSRIHVADGKITLID